MSKQEEFLTKKTKNTPKRSFRFNINKNRISRKTKELMEFEEIMSNTSYFRGLVLHSNYYDKLVWYCNCVEELTEYDFKYGWYNSSTLLSDIYDYYSIKGYVLEVDTQPYKEIQFQESVTKLMDIFVQYSKDYLGMKRLSESKYKEVVQWFCYHLCRCQQQTKIAIKYSRDENFIKVNKIYCPDFSYSIAIRLVDMLVHKGYCLSFIGNNIFETNIMSTLIINPKLLIDLDITSVDIVCNEPKNTFVEIRKDKTPIDPSEYKEDWLDELDIVDQIMQNYVTKINGCDLWIGGYKIPYLHFKRIYKDNIETCGRVFDDGTVQGKSKQVRSLITIDGESTVSLDLKSLHPRQLYLKEGIELEATFDPYPNVDVKLDTKLLNKFKKFYDIPSYNPIRNICKVMLLALINADSEASALSACFEMVSKDWAKAGTSKEQRMRFVGLKKGYSLKDIMEQIKLKNAPIEKYFCTGYGNKLQKMDSDIIVRCLNILTALDIPVIPIHDALICKQSDKVVVKRIIEDSYEFVMGSKINCIVEED
jgi:uncharacterized protein YlaI